jgi:hypothetical protein
MMSHTIYPIGTVGQPWGAAEKALWLQQQQIKRSYQHQVVTPIAELASELSAVAELTQYGELDYQQLGLAKYPLFAFKSRNWQANKPMVLVTGGVHGYESSGVFGALQFIREHFSHYSQRVNLLVLPCISPWGFETINRWNPLAIDPNRSFKEPSDSAEAAAVLTLLQAFPTPLVHVDLHETTDSDNSEFRPAKAARDGLINTNWNIPDGFYLVGDAENPQPEFQAAIIAKVGAVTQIAPADQDGCLIGEQLQQFGVINYPKKSLFLCGGMTDATYVTTTEVYPDSPNSSAEQCNQAQVVTVMSAIEFALARQ